jgi:hypothetical protein
MSEGRGMRNLSGFEAMSASRSSLGKPKPNPDDRRARRASIAIPSGELLRDSRRQMICP